VSDRLPWAGRFGDPDARLGFGFVTSRVAPIVDLGPYAGRLAAAAMASL